LGAWPELNEALGPPCGDGSGPAGQRAAVQVARLGPARGDADKGLRPGVFAAGDVRAGSTNRVAGAVGDGALATRVVHAVLDG
jgi:thioredoxin reductase